MIGAAAEVAPYFFGSFMPRKPKPLPTWEIYIAKAKATRLGTVEAADADTAIEAAAQEFKVGNSVAIGRFGPEGKTLSD
jgi:hypothetical protein